MHELSIALSLLEVAEAEAARHGGARVKAIHLRIGPLSGIVAEALTSAFELAREETPLNGATLVFEHVPISMQCPVCGEETPVVSLQRMCCVRCGTPATDLTGGSELEVTAMEIESC